MSTESASSPSDSSSTFWNSHIVSILVGVLITLLVLKLVPSSPTVAATENTQEAPPIKKKKKRNKKKSSAEPVPETVEQTLTTADENVVTSTTTTTEEEKTTNESTSATASVGGKKIKKKKNKKGASKSVTETNGSTVAPVSKTQPSREPAKTTTTTPTPSAPEPPKETPVEDDNWTTPKSTRTTQQAEEEAWSSVPTAKNRKRNKAGAAARPKAAAAPALQPKSVSVTVDAKKIGIIIGPKGATMLAIQDKTGTKLDVHAPSKDDPRASKNATVIITPGENGPADVNTAKTAVQELERLGYAKLLQAEGFSENAVTIHPKHLSEIVGPNGKTIKAIQTQLDVKITIPPTDWKPNKPQVGRVAPTCRVGVAGSNKANVLLAKQVIRSLAKYHFHELTHPGMVYEEVYVPAEYFHIVIGTRGSEIKHIKGNFAVDVHMPDPDTDNNGNVIVVGMQRNVVRAVAHIDTLMDRYSESRAMKYNDELYG